jgi:hypothetical protein
VVVCRAETSSNRFIVQAGKSFVVELGHVRSYEEVRGAEVKNEGHAIYVGGEVRGLG